MRSGAERFIFVVRGETPTRRNVALSRTLFGSDADVLRDPGFQALLLANVLGPLGSGLLSPILDSLIAPFGTSPADIGLLISVYTAPAIVMIPVAGVLADRIGRKPVLLGGLILFGSAGVSIALTTDFRVALALRLLQGVGFGAITPTIITSIGDLYDGTEEATAQGIRFTGSGLSSAVFPLLSGSLVVLAWQYPFFIYAMAFPIAAVVFVRFDEPTARDDDRADTDVEGTRSQLLSLARLLRQRRVIALVLARGLPMFVWIGFVTYNSIIVTNVMGGTPAQAGVLFAIVSLVYATAASQAGRVTDVFDSRFYPLVGAQICLAVGFVVFLFSPNLAVAGSGTVLLGIGFGLSLALYRSIITGLASESLRGGLVSVAESFGRVTATAAPICMGAIIAVTVPRVGLAAAVQTAGVAVAVLSSVAGIACLLVANVSPSVRYEA
jgi:MFS family permease